MKKIFDRKKYSTYCKSFAFLPKSATAPQPYTMYYDGDGCGAVAGRLRGSCGVVAVGCEKAKLLQYNQKPG